MMQGLRRERLTLSENIVQGNVDKALVNEDQLTRLLVGRFARVAPGTHRHQTQETHDTGVCEDVEQSGYEDMRTSLGIQC
jgi:hypothetical protein